MVDAGSPAEGQSGLSSDREPGDLQIAQATTAGARGDAIGIVNEVTGDVFIVHKDGTSEQAAGGMPVFADDILATGTDGAVEVVFKDGTTFSLGSNGQMRLDNLIYDPAGNNNGLDATIVKGSFVFITGNVGSAQGEGVSIDTPAGTIGIRGTSGGVAKDPQTGTWIFTLFRDPDGTLSRFTVTNPAGRQLLDQEFETTQVAGRRFAPSQTVLLSEGEAAALFSDALHLLRQQFPQLQRSELLEDSNPAAGEEQFAIDPGHLPPTPESFSQMFGALAGALVKLLGDDPNHIRDLESSDIIQTFLPVSSPNQLAPPIDDNPEPNIVAENVSPGTAVGITALVDDPRFIQSAVVYSLVDDADGRFVIDPQTGVVTVAPGAPPIDFESAATPFTIIVKATDGVHTSAAPMTITIENVNEAPTAIELSNATVDENAPGAVIGQLTAVDPDKGDSFTFSVSDERFEVAEIGGKEVLKLRDDASLDHEQNGAVAITVTVTDAGGLTHAQTFEITVVNVNDPPVAMADQYTVAEDGTLSVPANGVLANDTDPDDDALTATLLTNPAHGELTFNPDGSFTYTPDENYNGPDSFTYKANDGTADSNAATVNITVTAVNDPPVTADDSVKTAEDTPVTLSAASMLANDKDADGDQLKIASVGKAQHGTVTLNDDGSVTYMPEADYNGPDSFTYQASDGTAVGNVATVTVNLAPVNDAPLAVDDGPYATVENRPLSIALADLLKNDTDVERDDLAITDVKAVKGGTVKIDGDHVVFAPDQHFEDDAQFSYTVSDGHGGTDTAVVTVHVADDAPIAAADAEITPDRTTQSINLVIILDLSGSMGQDPGVAGFSTRLELARAAIAALFEAHGSVADLHIQIVGFSDSATASGWFDSVEDANAYLAALATGGGTNYAAAIQAAMAAFADAPDADKAEIYFLSDGVPSQGDSLREAGLVDDWEAFLADPDHGIEKAFAVGIGTDIKANDPDLADVAYPNDDPSTLLVVTNESQLTHTLVGTVANPVSGNVLDNDSFGADGKGNGGGGLLSITVDGVTYSYGGGKITSSTTPPRPPQIDGAKIVIPTDLGGSLEFHFDTGAYTYVPPDAIGNEHEDFTYTIVDGDGTTAMGTLTIDITDSGTVETDPHTVIGTDTGDGGADKLVGSAGDDIMSGGKGNDSISGGDGNDHIQGGNENDSLAGGGGIDIVIGGVGNDTLDGGAGADVLIGGAGTDSLIGGDGNDRIAVGTGDNADGGAGDDIILVTDNSKFGSVHGGGTAAVDLATQHGDVLALNGTLDLTSLANNKIDGIETVSMADSVGGAGADTLTLNASDVVDLGTGQFNPAGTFGGFGELPDAPAIRVDGDADDTLNLKGWQQVTTSPGGLPDGYVLYVHDGPAAGADADAYVLVQTAVKMTTG